MNKREFIKNLSLGVLGFSTLGTLVSCSSKDSKTREDGVASSEEGELFFHISLAQWSLHKNIFANEIDHLDFAATARKEFDIGAVEYVNQFFKDKAKDLSYLKEMKMRAEDHDVQSLLIMIDGEGSLGATNATERKEAVENHYKWVEAAKYLNCHSIRVNAAGEGSAEDVQKAAIEGLGQLSSFAADHDINVIVENHGGYSSNGQWLVAVIDGVGMENCGTLPDFGNFCIRKEDPNDWDSPCVEEYNKYKGVRELMPYAKGVSAKSYSFDFAGNEKNIDYGRMLKIVKDAGYTGHIGIEYEGHDLSEKEGIKATKELLERIGRGLPESG